MITVVAEDFKRHWLPKKIYLWIPGGWQMQLPEIQVDDDYRQRCIQHFRQKGVGRAQAQADALVQATGIVGFKASLLASVFYFAKLYCRMYPERLRLVPRQRNTFEPAGYDPGRIQAIHVPDRYPGTVGIQQANKLLMEMRL